jgi:transmembrane sensor
MTPTTPHSESPDRNLSVDEVAARWVVSLDENPTLETRAEFEKWRQADARHAAAFARAKSLRDALGSLGKLKQHPEIARLRAEANSPRSRRPVVVPFAIALAAAAAVVLGMFTFNRQAATRSDTHVESHAATDVARLVALPDGSKVELNTASRLEVAFTAHERRVTLRSGEAHFTVTKDPTRPFIVSASDVAVRAVGTAFNVRIASAAVEVLVTEGRVAVGQLPPAVAAAAAPPAAPPAPLVPALDAGQRVVVSTAANAPTPQIETVDAAAIERALAWQTSVLVFSETPLGEAVAQFNRRNRVQIVIADRELETQRIGGNIRVENPETFARVLETSGDIIVDRSDPTRLVLRKAR